VDLFEHQAKELFARHGVPVPTGKVATTPEQARAAAEEGMHATVPMQARKGRASYLGERSVGHQDPGATSTTLIVAALERTVAEES